MKFSWTDTGNRKNKDKKYNFKALKNGFLVT
jgi:hypothetical protein